MNQKLPARAPSPFAEDAETYAGKPHVRVDEGRSQAVIGLWPLNPSTLPPLLRIPSDMLPRLA